MLWISFYSILSGVILGWLAALTGLLDLVKLSDKIHHAAKNALIHGSINGLVLTGYSGIVFYQYMHFSSPHPDTAGLLAFKGFLIIVLLVGNYLGGNLILKNKIAVIE